MRGFSNTCAADDERIEAAAEVLRRGELVVFPTETLYGLGADALDEAALQRLVAVKGREPGKPIAVLISGLSMIDVLAAEVSPRARVLMRCFWPGPLTLVLPARAGISPLLTGGADGIGVRLSSHPMATALVSALGRPITAPSANPAGLAAPARLEEARAYFGNRVEYYLDGGCLAGEPASTVVDVREELQVLREGALAAEAIRASLREEVARW